MNYHLSSFVSTLLQRIPIERLLCNESKLKNEGKLKIYYDELDEGMVEDLMLTYYPYIGDAAINGMIEEICSQFDSKYMGLVQSDKPNKLNIFSMLFSYVRDVLTIHDNSIVCQYTKLLEWNELTRVIGKDLPITAFLVYSDWENGETRENFFWPPVIGHDNGQLNKVLSKGMAENHFHLRGSTPYFDISWINLMNHPTKLEYLKELDNLETNLRDKHKKAVRGFVQYNFRDMVRAAALIRLHLSERLKGRSFDYMNDNDSLELSKGEGGSKGSDAGKKLEAVKQILASTKFLELNAAKVDNEIDLVHWRNRDVVPDYLLHYVKSPVYAKDVEYWILSGERWFLYNMLKNIFSKNKSFYRDEYNMFLAYIRIKNELRGELIQNNDIYGFDNFQRYDRRKDAFSHEGEWIQAEGILARLAVRDVLSNPAVKHLELRISPGETAEKIMLDIKGYDYFILKNNDKGKERKEQLNRMKVGGMLSETGYNEEQKRLQNRYHYVFHFTKRKDTGRGIVEKCECRHFEFRNMLLQRTAEIVLFRERYPQFSDRLVGIDACSREIGCRPEVFGRAFRTLRFYIPPEPKTAFQSDHPARQLQFTYHVGEDYLDVVDGLRAIDEAIRFLRMDMGDRLGHAMALGINAIRWYAERNHMVTLPIQDYIDNIVWMHHSLVEFCIEDFDSLKGWIEGEYRRYFDHVYQSFVYKQNKKRDNLRDEEDYNDEGTYNTVMVQNGFDIHTYYLSWLLRGDAPEIYKNMKFEKNIFMDQWKKFAINEQVIETDNIRNTPQVSLLYHIYHYDDKVRSKGNEVKTFKLHRDYPRAVSEIQKKMQHMVDEKGIAIETNPSSNFKISSLGSFANHPIVNLYNMGLEMDTAKLYECSQMNVSINTDDEGVFSTRLENEYALLARSLEEAIDQNGNHLYKRQNIYQWLDNIREMGLRQSFYNIDEV